MFVEYCLRAIALIAVLLLFVCSLPISVVRDHSIAAPALGSVCVVYLIYFVFYRPRHF